MMCCESPSAWEAIRAPASARRAGLAARKPASPPPITHTAFSTVSIEAALTHPSFLIRLLCRPPGGRRLHGELVLVYAHVLDDLHPFLLRVDHHLLHSFRCGTAACNALLGNCFLDLGRLHRFNQFMVPPLDNRFWVSVGNRKPELAAHPVCRIAPS